MKNFTRHDRREGFHKVSFKEDIEEHFDAENNNDEEGRFIAIRIVSIVDLCAK